MALVAIWLCTLGYALVYTGIAKLASPGAKDNPEGDILHNLGLK